MKYEIKIPTECYSRIVGYYRPINNWNNGKKQEFRERKNYNIENFEVKKEEKKIA